ncbi:hypothetical protein BAY59_10690 [Prauserella coralliicola]|nr:hypothetical protein BAY59_10690 [Prauserella coralliicola]
MSWMAGPRGDHALLSRDQYLALWLAIQDQDDDVALDLLREIKPRHWPDPDALTAEPPERPDQS